MLPMGTIMACTMLVGALFALRPSILKSTPKAVNNGIAGLVLLGGSWNIFWYWLNHLTEFWGLAALISGTMMLVTAGYICNCNRMPLWLKTLRPVVLFILLACALTYGIAIYNL